MIKTQQLLQEEVKTFAIENNALKIGDSGRCLLYCVSYLELLIRGSRLVSYCLRHELARLNSLLDPLIYC